MVAALVSSGSSWSPVADRLVRLLNMPCCSLDLPALSTGASKPPAFLCPAYCFVCLGLHNSWGGGVYLFQPGQHLGGAALNSVLSSLLEELRCWVICVAWDSHSFSKFKWEERVSGSWCLHLDVCLLESCLLLLLSWPVLSVAHAPQAA